MYDTLKQLEQANDALFDAEHNLRNKEEEFNAARYKFAAQPNNVTAMKLVVAYRSFMDAKGKEAKAMDNLIYAMLTIDYAE